MKRLLFITFIATLFIFIHSNSSAQVIKIGGGAELRADPPASLFIKGTYNLGILDENMRASVDFLVLPKFETNLDFHYSFLNEFGMNGYGLAGVNYDKDFGANIGAGFMYNLSEELDAVGEVKYIIKNDPQASIKLGVLYYL